MSTYELPDGFEGMDSLPKCEYVTCIDERGWPQVMHSSLVKPSMEFIGWSPVVPPKKRRFVVKAYIDPDGVTMYRVHTTPPHLGGWIAERLPNESSAQAVADIYEQAYEVTP